MSLLRSPPHRRAPLTPSLQLLLHHLLQRPIHHLHKCLHELLQPYPILLSERSQPFAIHIEHPYQSPLVIPHRHHNLTLGHPIACNVARAGFYIRDDDRLPAEEGGGAYADGAQGRGGAEGNAVAGWTTVKGTEEEGGRCGVEWCSGFAGEKGGVEVEACRKRMESIWAVGDP